MRSIAITMFTLAVAAAASAQTDYRYEKDRYDDRYGTESYSGTSNDADRFSIRTGVGFHSDPTGFLLGFEGDYAITGNFSTGVQLHVGVDDDRTIVAPVVYGRFRGSLGGVDGSLAALYPHLQVGLGFTHWDQDRPFPGTGTTSDTEFLLNFGPGVEYWFLENVAVGSHMGFNIVPDEIFGNRFYFTWEVLTLRYRF